MSGTVLAVDEAPRYRAPYSQVLSAAAITVSEAFWADEAIGQSERRVPDMVVSDVRMPGASGLDHDLRPSHPGSSPNEDRRAGARC